MASTQPSLLVRLLRQVRGAACGQVEDAELLRRYVVGCDEAAFELLLWRHGALVLRVCRDLLGREHDAEDAFQATFLVLARKASSVRRGTSLPAWLHRVATRAALRLRRQLARRADRERLGHDLSLAAAPGDVTEDVALAELRPWVQQEIDHLPERYRLPLLLCGLQGLSHEEAADRLGWRPGTLAGRLARARALLARRLAQRGVAVPATMLSLLLTASAGAEPSAALVATAARAGSLAVAGPSALVGAVSPRVITLTEEVLRTMFLSKLKLAGTLLLALCALGIGAGTWLASGHSTEEPLPGEQAQDPSTGTGDPGAAATDPATTASAAASSRKSLKAIGLAMHNHVDTMAALPRSAIYRNGRPILSWRVALLPYLGEEALYKEFNLNEPWDSPHNRRLLARMPAVYRIPGVQPANATATYFQVIVGNGALFEEPRPGEDAALGGMMGAMGGAPGSDGGGVGVPGGAAARPGGAGPGAGGGEGGSGPGLSGPPGSAGFAGGGFPGAGMGSGGPAMGPPGISVWRTNGATLASVTDGTSNTLLVVEGESPVAWTKPEDLPYSPIGRLPRLGGLFGHVFHAAFADGSVHAIDRRTNETTLHAAITRAGGEVYDRDDMVDPVTTTDLNHLRRENQELEGTIRRTEGDVQELRRRLRREGSQTTRVPSEVETLQREQRDLRREVRRLEEEAAMLQEKLNQLKKPGKMGKKK